MSDSPVSLLRQHARHAPWNARGLAAHVAALADAAGVKPTNASARAAPSARAIRFYVAHGLLDRPEGAGTAATYHYRHFLQLLAIKIRQREGRTLDAIRAELTGVAGDALERKVAQALMPLIGVATPARAEDAPQSWRRVRVTDGVELHLREDVPVGEERLDAVREAVRLSLGRGEAHP